MIIAGTKIPRGKKVTLDIPISTLPTNTAIDLVADVYRSNKPGPTLLIIGGVHGDEINGIEIVKRAELTQMFNNLTTGAVISIPLLNVFGFINFSRGLPDGKDVNRSFPGVKRGSLASRVAHTLTNEILPHVDLALDFHTGGASIYNYPQVRVNRDDKESLKLASQFGMPILIKGGLIKKSLRKTAFDMDIPMIVFEGGESQRMDEFSIKKGLEGIKRVLIAQKMMKSTGKTKAVKSTEFNANTWVRAPRSGMLTCLKVSGDEVAVGEVLGAISGPYGNFDVKVKAKKAGTIYGHNNRPVVNQGDALFHIGYN